MREIKFRAWDKKEKRMYPFADMEMVNEDWGIKRDDNIVISLSLGEIEVMQFTGLHDKNGKEIYEGDIIETDYFSNVNPNNYDDDNYLDNTPRASVVKWNNSLAKFIINDFGNNSKVKVIGNIYETPELLKGAK